MAIDDPPAIVAFSAVIANPESDTSVVAPSMRRGT